MTEMRKSLPLPEQEEEEVLFWLQEEIVVDPQTGKRGYWRTVRRGGKWVHIFIAAEGSLKPPDVIVMVGPAGEIRLRLNPAAGTFGQIKDKIKALGGWWDSLTKTWWFPEQEPTTVLRKIGAELAQTGDVEVGWTPQAMGQWASYLVGETLGKEVPQRVLEVISSGELWLQKIPEENWDGFVRFLYERGAFGRGGYADFALRFLGDMQQRYGRRLANLTSRQQEVWRNINRGVAKWLRDNPTQAEEALRFFPATKEEESPTPIEEPQKETGPPTAKTIEQVAAGGEYDFEAILGGNRVTALALMQAIQDGRLPPVTQLPFLRQDELIEGQMPLHQQAGIWWLLAKRRGFLAYEAGLGKTLCFLGASLLRQFGIASSEGVKSTSLIVVPASRVLGTKAEIERFFQIPAEEIFVIPPGTPAQERAAMLNRIRPSNPPRFIIVSYDIMRIEAERLKQVLKPLRVASIIADEAHYVKDWKAQRTRAFFDIVEEKRHGAAVWLVSATPFSNASPSEVFNLLYGMGAWPNMRRNDAWLQFAHRYCEQRRSALAKWWEWLEGAPRRIYQNFGSVILHLPKDDESVKRFFPQAIRDYAYLDWDAVHGPFATFYATLEDLYSTIREAARTTGERTLGGKALGLINLLLWAVSAPETIKQEDLERAFSHEAEHWTPEEVRQKIIEVGEEKVASALAAAE
ncbi:MAG: SNF2-related protein, partial [Nitrososphaerota archaeon]